jgi:hypothetical protein
VFGRPPTLTEAQRAAVQEQIAAGASVSFFDRHRTEPPVPMDHRQQAACPSPAADPVPAACQPLPFPSHVLAVLRPGRTATKWLSAAVSIVPKGRRFRRDRHTRHPVAQRPHPAFIPDQTIPASDRLEGHMPILTMGVQFARASKWPWISPAGVTPSAKVQVLLSS